MQQFIVCTNCSSIRNQPLLVFKYHHCVPCHFSPFSPQAQLLSISRVIQYELCLATFFSITFVRFIHLVLLIVDHSLLIVCSTVLYFVSVCEGTPTFLYVCIHVKARRQSWMDVILHVPFTCFEPCSLTGLELAKQARLADSDLSVPISPVLGLHVCATVAIFTHTGMHAKLCTHARTLQNVRTTCGSWFTPSTRWLQKVKLGFKCPVPFSPCPFSFVFLCYFLFREIVRQCLIIWTRLASHILLPPESWD